jgi:hypothetical protein
MLIITQKTLNIWSHLSLMLKFTTHANNFDFIHLTISNTIKHSTTYIALLQYTCKPSKFSNLLYNKVG